MNSDEQVRAFIMEAAQRLTETTGEKSVWLCLAVLKHVAEPKFTPHWSVALGSEPQRSFSTLQELFAGASDMRANKRAKAERLRAEAAELEKQAEALS